MKKVLAVALALMMLLASAAFAETANVATLSNFNLMVTNPDGTMSVDLSGLKADIAMGMANDAPIIQLDVSGDGEKLLGAVIQFIEGKLALAIDGVSRPMVADMGPTAGQAQETLNELFANLDQASDVKLPAFTGVAIPKVDLMQVPALFGATPTADENGVQTASFSLPYEMVKQMLDMILPMIPEQATAQLGPIVDQVKSGALGIALEGKVADDGNTAEMLVDIYMVQNGVTAEAPALALYFASAENNDSFEVLVYQEGDTVTLGQLDLASDPAAATLDVGLDLMGQVKLNFSLYPEDGAQVAALAVTAEGETINASLTYGEEGEKEYADFAFELPSQDVAASIHLDEAPDGNGNKAGALEVSVAAQGQTVNLTCDLVEGKGDVQFRPIGSIANAIDANNVSEADANAFGAELESAIAPLLSYISSLEAQPAA